MDAADAAGREEVDAGESAGRQRAADGGRPERALRDAGAEVARAGLPRLRARGGDSLELRRREPDAERPLEHGHGRGHDALGADARLALAPDGDPLSGWQSV